MLSTLRIAPLLSVPLAVFVLCALIAQGGEWASGTAFVLDMFSGARWSVSFGDLFVLASLSILFVETVKAVNTTAGEIVNHGLSMLVAVLCLVLFVTMPAFTNSTFFLLTAMAFFDVAAGFAITIVSARRDIGSQAH
jgi:hypothetical protein